MSPSNSQVSPSTLQPEKSVEDAEVNAMMGLNRVNLGMNGLAGSMYADPGMTFGTKREILEEMERKNRGVKEKKTDEAEKAKVNGVETKATQAGDAMEMDSSTPNGTA